MNTRTLGASGLESSAIADAVLRLCNPDASFVIDHALVVDGDIVP